MNGIAGMEPDNLSSNLQPLFDTILRVPMAKVDPTKSLQMLIANIDYDEFKGIYVLEVMDDVFLIYFIMSLFLTSYSY